MIGISVIITAYKTQNFIEDCVHSLRHQQTNFPFEIIIGIDACPDTLEVAKKLPDVSVYYNENNIGAYVMRNTLTKKAKFDNLVFFDSDDIAKDNLLQVMFDSLQKTDLVRCGFYNFKTFGNYNLCKVPAFGAFGIRKNVFLSLKGFQGWRFGADSEFIARCEQFDKTATLIGDGLFFRRVHRNSLTHNPETGMNSKARKELKAILVPKIKEKNLENPEILETTKIKSVVKGSDLAPIESKEIGIGITTFNRNSQLMTTLLRIKKHTPRGAKIVIVDDGSTIAEPQATFRFNKNQGSPIAKNKCLELLDDCEHIFLFDDDTYPISDNWFKPYIESPEPHLNYTFKYKFDEWENHNVFDNPNGCMMYFHKSVLNKVGGFDTGFIKYGYWHGSMSCRIYNAGLTSFPFMDVVNSKDLIYSLDQDGKINTATKNRGDFLARNKKRYFDKLGSSEYISYKMADFKVWYSNPYSTEKNFGKALNDFCELVPDNDWICLQDGDMMYLTPDWGVQIEAAIKKYGQNFSLIGCVTNRLSKHKPIQLVPGVDYDNHDMRYHYQKALELKEKHYAEVEDITDKKYIAGLFMLFPKRVWNKVKFKENINYFDHQFSTDVIKAGGRLGLMKGLYVYHLYRIWSDNPSKAREHLF